MREAEVKVRPACVQKLRSCARSVVGRQERVIAGDEQRQRTAPVALLKAGWKMP
jgi:hypothetical protein